MPDPGPLQDGGNNKLTFLHTNLTYAQCSGSHWRLVTQQLPQAFPVHYAPDSEALSIIRPWLLHMAPVQTWRMQQHGWAAC